MASGKGFPNTIVSIEAVTRRIEQGLLYTAVADDPAVAQDGTLSLLVKTPSQPLSPMILEYIYGGAATLEFFENTIVSADGAAIPAVNHRRIPPVRPAATTLFQNPTVTDDGDVLIPIIDLPGGSSGKNTAGGSDETLFWVLAPGLNYLLRLTNKSNSAESMAIVANFVETVGPLSSGT